MAEPKSVADLLSYRPPYRQLDVDRNDCKRAVMRAKRGSHSRDWLDFHKLSGCPRTAVTDALATADSCLHSLCSHALCRRQRGARPGDELFGLVEQPIRNAPEGEVDRAALLAIVERWSGRGF